MAQIMLMAPRCTPKAFWRSNCVPRRCGGCNFDLYLGEEVLIVSLDGRTLGPYVYDPDGFGLRGTAPCYIPCKEDCWHTQRTPACHVQCSSGTIVEDDDESRRDFIDTVAYSWPSSQVEKMQRDYYFRQVLIEAPEGGPSRDEVPLHVLSMHAVRYARTRWLWDQRIHTVVLLTKTIWIRYTIYEGTKYVASLTNDPPEDDEETLPLVMPNTADLTLYLAEDYLGIRELAFLKPKELPLVPRKAGIFWRTFPVHSTDVPLECKTDGIKLRSVSWHDMFDANSVVLWSTPQPPHFNYQMYSSGRRSLTPRMDYIDCNGQGITGYSVCWAESMVTLRSHGDGENLNYYHLTQQEHPSAIWLHLAISSGEYITQTWQLNTGDHIGIILAFVTSLGRVKVLGWRPEAADAERQFHWTLVKQFTQFRDRIYYQDSPAGVRCVAFEGIRPQTPPDNSFVPPPVFSPHQHRGPMGLPLDFHSSARLDEATKIRLCTYEHDGMQFAMGFLVTYAHGRRDSVGEIRMNRLSSNARSLGSRTSLWLGHYCAISGGPQHIAIALDQPEPSRDREQHRIDWVEVPLRGVLEWWFAPNRRRVYHNGRPCAPQRDPLIQVEELERLVEEL